MASTCPAPRLLLPGWLSSFCKESKPWASLPSLHPEGRGFLPARGQLWDPAGHSPLCPVPRLCVSAER